MGIGNPIHLMFLAAVALVVLGPKRLPELARALGKGMQEFRDSMNEAVNAEDPSPSAPVPGQPQLVAAEPVASTEAPIVQPGQVSPEQSAPPSSS